MLTEHVCKCIKTLLRLEMQELFPILADKIIGPYSYS